MIQILKLHRLYLYHRIRIVEFCSIEVIICYRNLSVCLIFMLFHPKVYLETIFILYTLYSNLGIENQVRILNQNKFIKYYCSNFSLFSSNVAVVFTHNVFVFTCFQYCIVIDKTNNQKSIYPFDSYLKIQKQQVSRHSMIRKKKIFEEKRNRSTNLEFYSIRSLSTK